MAWAIYPSLFFTVAMLVTTAYFIMGGLPLLVLDHDTALDARFVHRFFNLYYRAALVAAAGACISYALWGRWAFALGCGALALVAIGLRRTMVPAMQRLGAQIQASGQEAVRAFRQVHGAALAINAVQLVLLVWGTIQITL